MLIRALTKDDIPAWLALAHESDDIVARMVPDITVFYDGFNEYMERKIKQHEAFMAVDRMSGKCLGAVAYSKKHNRISFFGVNKDADFQNTGGQILEVAMNQLEWGKEITANVIKSDAPIVKQERALYKKFGFKEHGKTIVEAGVPAWQIVKAAAAEKTTYSFHHNFSEYMGWFDEEKCPVCNHEIVWGDHDLVVELKCSTVHADIKPGRLWGTCLVLSKKHLIEIHELTFDELMGFMTDVRKTARALKEVSGAVKINMEQHGNSVPHLHMHLFPRYLDDAFPRKSIDYNVSVPSPYESKAEYDYFIEQMREKLSV